MQYKYHIKHYTMNKKLNANELGQCEILHYFHVHSKNIYKYYIYDTNKRILPLLQNIQFLRCVPYKKIILSQNITNLIIADGMFIVNMLFSKNITHLSILNKNNFKRKIKLPCSVTHLKCGHYFNEKIKLPQNITHLITGYYFNKKIKLPQSITYLQINHSCNNKIMLSQNITHLVIGIRCNCKIIIPRNIIFLTINDNYVNYFKCKYPIIINKNKNKFRNIHTP